MSDSEKNSIGEDVANLDPKKTEASDDSNTCESTESMISINLLTTESLNSNITVTMQTVANGTKNKEQQSMITTEGAESGDSEQQCFNKNLKTAGNFTKPPSKSHHFPGPRRYLSLEANANYLARLIKEKEELMILLPPTFYFKHAVRLVNEEISKVRENIARIAQVNESEVERPPEILVIPTSGTHQKVSMDKPRNGKKIFLQEKIFIPVNEYPNYNFVGRILGPRGMTAKQLEEESGCRIMIRGRGSTREGSSHRQNVYNNHLKEELHVLIQCEDFEENAKEKMRRAVKCIRYMLVPPPEGEDELKRKQLMELSIINGTYRPTIGSRIALRNRSFLTPLNFGQLGTGNMFNGGRMNNLPVISNGGRNENGRQATLCDPRTGLNLPYDYGQQFSYNTIITRQALASLGFDMDAFEVTDYFGKRMSRTSTGVSGRQTTTTAPTATQYSRHHYGFVNPVIDPFTMQYMWNSPINSSVFGIVDSSSNSLARGYYNQVITGLSPTVNNEVSFDDETTQSSNTSRVNLQQYMTASTLLNGVSNFRTDGSGDGPNNYR